jgi:DNA replication ATP-dependent helicase Dna2
MAPRDNAAAPKFNSASPFTVENKLHQFTRLYDAALVREPVLRLPLQLKLFGFLLHELTASSAIQFYTRFAQVSYLVSRLDLSGRWAYALHITRRELQARQLSDEAFAPIAESCVRLLLHLLERQTGPTGKASNYPMPALPRLPEAVRHTGARKAYARVVVSEWDPEKRMLTAVDEDDPSTAQTIHYGVAGINDLFAGTLEEAIRHAGLPMVLGLADVRYPQPHQAIPGYIVIFPDLLAPVTDIAGMIPGPDHPSAANLPGRFIATRETTTLLKGQVANLFLDELVCDPERSFDDLIRAAFRAFPLVMSRLNDEETRALVDDLRGHFRTIRSVVTEAFRREQIDRTACHIEPSYFSPRYGLKGRLDLFHETPDGRAPTIIELKSGKPFRPNHYNLNEDHYRQTLLYDLIIRSTHRQAATRRNFVLYSGQAEEPLRFAAPAEGVQKELIHGRNQLVLLDFMLTEQGRPGVPDLFATIHPSAFPGLSGFQRRNVQAWADVYTALPDADKAYLRAFAGFVAREHMLAAVGRDMGEGSGGVAGLWLDPIRVKEERYALLRGLRLLQTDTTGGQTQVVLGREPITHPLANFRDGDIVVMYPYSDDPHPDPTSGQLYRATIVAIDQETLTIQLRNPQVNTRRFGAGSRWNLEPDMLDSSYGKLYESLWTLVSAPAPRRAIVLGRQAPGWTAIPAFSLPTAKGLTAIQQRIFHEGIRAEGLYLLWGPPGTGKTSVMLRAWVHYLHEHRPYRLLLLAYTNRAVDEICAAISGPAGPVADTYIRIGSRSGTGAAYRHRLLDEVIKPLDRRSDIRTLMERTRVYVGTVSSFLGRSEILELLHFDVAIIDEASQLLEPAITGLLTRVPKAILIGDHMQLPAVSQQFKASCVLPEDDPRTVAFGITDLRMSYFERMYRLFQSRGWHGAIGTLGEQGRMHRDIMAAANQLFYGGALCCLDDARQTFSLGEELTPDAGPITESRLIFIHVPQAPDEALSKTSIGEAVTVVRLLQMWQSMIERQRLGWQIGVITPFRAQIAAILHHAHEMEVDMRGITVDTVERYQGGARDIVIMSTVAGHPAILDRIVSENLEGVDRKLNVAITRAREQFILVGDGQTLAGSPGYARLIDMCRHIDASLLEDLTASGLPA